MSAAGAQARAVPPYRVSVRLYVTFSLLMAVAATASGLLLLYIARPFITELGGPLAAKATVLLFAGAALAGALAAVGGLFVGLRFAGRIRGIVEKAEALSPFMGEEYTPKPARDELGALDAALGRLTLSMDRFVRDSDILARLPEGMLLLGPAGGLLSFNATAETLLGMPLERYRGAPVLSSAGPIPVGRGNAALAQVLGEAANAGGPVQMSEVSIVTAGGRQLSLEITAQRREWGADASALLLLMRDASEKQRIRDEIRRGDQLAFLGGMAAKVAHEIRTPLATIRGLLELLEADLPEGDSRRGYIERVLQALDRQDRLVENLLTLSHPEPKGAKPIAVAELLRDVLGMFPRDHRLSLDLGPEALPPIWGDAFRLGEVFTNLIQNALQASSESGSVELMAQAVGDERVRIQVRNTGAGIPAELRERIFQPFFTTKARGTGLGLAIARQIVEAHGGTIRVDSDGASETTFVVELPTVEPVAAPAH
jgi:signal transduction histidine kinase